MTDRQRLPPGFSAAGINAGIKNSKRDLGIIVADRDSVFAACTTTNKSRAHCVNRTERIIASAKTVRAVIACSGNANALTGPAGVADDEEMARLLAEAIGVRPDEVLTASTGVIGARLPVSKIADGVAPLLRELSPAAASFAEAIITTDRTVKIASREVFINGTQVHLQAVSKGAGMIQPAMATMLCFVTTDAAIKREVLQSVLRAATDTSFNQITVDNDMSTNDMVMVLANGAAENDPITEDGAGKDAFADALTSLLEEAAISIARDGEGATRLLEVEVVNAASESEARDLAKGIAGGSLVKAGIFGADPYSWGRILGALGAKAAQIDATFDVDTLSLSLQDAVMFDKGAPVSLDDTASNALKHRMKEQTISARIDLGVGTASGMAWGCDMTYDYVKINADYASVTLAAPDGSVSVNERLGELGPTLKKKLLIEALRYIYKFRGTRAVIKLGGAAMVDPQLEAQFAEDVLLLESVGLRPIVVHGGGPEISRTLDRLGHATEFHDGLRITDEPSMAVVEMVLSGKVNQRLVAAINHATSKGVGLSGKDGGLIRARKFASTRDLGRVGEVERVDTTLIEMLIEDGRIPVVSPVGLGDDGIAYNINADVVAAELASALKAEKLIFMSDVPGFLEDDKVVAEMTADQLKGRIDRGAVTGGMLPKLSAALTALRRGVRQVHLVDGRVAHNLIAELFTDSGVGTLIRKD